MTEIEKFTRSCIKEMEQSCLELPWEDARTYGDWVAQTYFYVRHATRVLAKAAFRCTIEQEDLHKVFLKGINEEKNHEIMAVNDLKHMGLRLGDYYEYPETSAYYQTLYHLIDYNGPYELLGYFVNLEGLGAIGCDGFYDKIIKSHGEKAASFIKVHARIDARHFQEGIDLLNSLKPEQLKIVRHGLEISTPLYCNMIRRVTQESYKRRTAA